MVILDSRSQIIGTPTAMSTAGDARFGIVRRFASASSAYISLAHATALSMLGNMSFVAWIKPASYANYRMLFTKTIGAIAAPYSLFLQIGSGIPVWFRGNGSSEAAAAASAAPIAGVWSMIGVSQAGNTATHYLNGITNGSGTITTSMADGGNPLYIGKRSDGYYFDGDMAFIQIVPRALSAAEMLFLAQNPPIPFGRSLRDDEYPRTPMARLFSRRVSPAMRWWHGA